MAALAKIDLWNRAIGRLPATPIASVDENSLEARECRRYYPAVLSDMFEGPHDWSFANTRVPLAQLLTNDRSAEWLFAYQLPSNVGNPIRVLPDLNALGLSLPMPLPGDPYSEIWATMVTNLEAPYVIEGQTLYTNAEGATLEYTVGDIDGVPVPQLAITALEIDLAARICVPVKKDSAREKDLVSLAEIAWQRAIADDNNRNPQSYGDYVSESMIARHGGC